MIKEKILSLDLGLWLYRLSLPGIVILLLCGIFQVGEPAGFSALTGTVLLLATLLPAAAVRLSWWKDNAYVRLLLRHQRQLGICSGLWFVAHGAASALFFFDRGQPLAEQFTVPALRPTWVLLPVMLLLLATSLPAVQQAMGERWKRIHTLVWLLPFPMMLHGNLALLHFEKEEFAPATILVLVLVAVAVIEAVKTKKGYRLLWVLAGMALAGLIAFTA
jgi:DMSO/TMAO reductase YedYZ heme-binding membrane subunit